MEPKHTYKLGLRGRAFKIDPASGQKAATICCSLCDAVGVLPLHSLMPPEIIDKKFVQKGWELDPNTCPDCVVKRERAKAAAKAAKKEQRIMNAVTNTKPAGALADNPALKAVSVDLHKATAKMHQLLAINFDSDEGRYAEGWDDERIAKESGMSPAHVTEVRNVAYGELKEPEEITSLRNDIKALHDLINETLITAQKEVNALNNRIAEITKKLGIK